MGRPKTRVSTNSKLRYVQINLKHSSEASDNLIIFLIKNNIDIAFIQEPWVKNQKIYGLRHSEFNIFFKVGGNGGTRACILARKKLTIHLMPNLSDGDTTVTKLENGGKSIMLISAYMPHGEPAPTNKIQELLRDRHTTRSETIIACDANARHQLWGNKDTNERGESLLDFINNNNIMINNKGSVPTFIFPSTQSWKGWDAVLDLTLSRTNNTNIFNWNVSLENSYSDHRYIMFESDLAITETTEPFRNPRNTDWEKFQIIINKKLNKIHHTECTIESIEQTVCKIEQSYNSAFSVSCKVNKSKINNLPQYFTKELLNLRQKLRSQFNKSFATSNWGEYRTLLSLYTKAKRAAKRDSWKNLCEAIDTPEGTARLGKMLKRAQSAPSFIMNEDGVWTKSSQETNIALLNTHFPGCTTNEVTQVATTLTTSDLNLDKILSREKIEWAIKSFEPYKSAGIDGVIPKMLQVSIDSVTTILQRIYKDCFTLAYMPMSWRKVKVVFIPKLGKLGHSVAKDFRPISLTSFLLKTLERLLDIHIRAFFNEKNISKSQHAYMKGRSVETALHKVLGYAEKAIHHKQMALTSFLDIEGAFNNVTIDSIKDSLEKLNIEVQLIDWIVNMLISREIHSKIGENSEIRYVSRGTPQGGVLSPLLWLLVVNQILLEMEPTGAKITAYADDLAITILGHDKNTIRSKMETTLEKISEWAQNSGLNINPTKTKLILFTTKREIFETPNLRGVKLQLSTSAKFLGVILTPKVDWKAQIAERVKKAQAAFYTFRSAIGKTWGISPKLTMWIYTAIVRPILLYGIAIWWKALEKKYVVQNLNKIQRMALLSTTGALRTTSTEALEILTNVPPVDLVAMEMAAKTAARLSAIKSWDIRDYGHSTIVGKYKITTNSCDYIIPQSNFGRRFKVKIPSREDWTKNDLEKERDINLYTDGSKTGSGSGAGVWSKWGHISYSYKLPDFATVFQSEIYAILMACTIIIDRNVVNKDINIFVDSQAALKAIDRSYVKSSLTKKCLRMIDKVCDNNKVTLTWIPGHRNIDGNEKADLLARQGSSRHQSWTSKIEIPLAEIYLKITRDTTHRWGLRWKNSTKGKAGKSVWPELNTKASDKLLALNRPKLKSLVYAVTGHWNTGKHAERLGINNSLTCKRCDTPNKDVDLFHFWCDCPAIARARMETFNEYFLYELPKLDRFNIDILADYIKETKWF